MRGRDSLNIFRPKSPGMRILERGGQSWENKLYNEGDLIFRYNENSRSGNTLPNAVNPGTGDATLLPAVYLYNGSAGYFYGDKTRTEELLWDGNDHTIFCELTQMKSLSVDTTYPVLKIGTNTTGVSRGIYIFLQYKALRVRYGDGIVAQTEVSLGLADTYYLPHDRVYLYITINAATKVLRIYIYNESLTAINGSGNKDISTFSFGATQNTIAYTFDSSYFGVSNFKKFTGIKTLEQCINSSYTTDLQLHYPSIFGSVDLVGGKNLVGNGSQNVKYFGFAKHTPWLFDYGYDRYVESSASNAGIFTHHYISHDNLGASKTYSKSNFAKLESIAGSLTGINTGGEMAGFKIRFSQDFFDRSNVTIWNDACRASSYYDSSHKKDFHSSELNYRILYGYLNDGYKGKFYPHFENYSIKMDNSYSDISRKKLKNIFLYNTDNKGIYNGRILTYTRDIAAAVLDESNLVTYDSDEYVKIGTYKSSKPMVIFRFDDEFDSQGSWLTLFNSHGIVGTLVITTDNVGKAGYLTWSQIKLFQDAGWEIGFHSTVYNTTYWSSLTASQLAEMMATGKSLIEANGLICNFCSPHGTNNDAGLARYVARNYFNSFSGYVPITGEVGLNPAIIDPFNLRQAIIDMEVATYPYNIEDAGGMAKCKALVDTCVSENRIVEFAGHNYTAPKATALSELIEYCQSNEVSIVTKSQAFNNCKFL